MRSCPALRWLPAPLLLVACSLTDPVAPDGVRRALPVAPTAAVTAFLDDFSSPVLDPAWTVIPGARYYYLGFGLPVNDYSLTANPGHLRYTINPMSHMFGFLNGHAVAPPPQLNAVYAYDPGLEIWRPVLGDYWLLEAKGTFFLPCANGRAFFIFVHFGPGGPGTRATGFYRGGDIPTCWGESWLSTYDAYLPGPTTDLGTVVYDGAGEMISGPALSTVWLRLERNGSVLTWRRSFDGLAWTDLFTKDYGTALDGLDQRVTIVGHSWFVPAGSYADWDYVSVTPTTIPVALDIMPGSSENPVNSKKKGVIPVAVLGSADFDAPVEVDRATLTFGRTGDEASLRHCGDAEDVNGDAFLDLVCHFEALAAGFQPGDTMGHLKGATTAGVPIAGSDAVRVK